MTGVEVKEWREKRGLSRAKLAELLPVSLRTLEGWEMGKGKPGSYLRRALADLERELGMMITPETLEAIKAKAVASQAALNAQRLREQAEAESKVSAPSAQTLKAQRVWERSNLDAVAPPAGQGKASIETYQRSRRPGWSRELRPKGSNR